MRSPIFECVLDFVLTGEELKVGMKGECMCFSHC